MSRLANELAAAVESAANKWAQVTLGLAVKRAPVDEGTLRDSAVAVTHRSGDVILSTLSFNTIYAARQHEGFDFAHPKGGEPKYLESAVKDNAGKVEPLLVAARDAILAKYR